MQKDRRRHCGSTHTPTTEGGRTSSPMINHPRPLERIDERKITRAVTHANSHARARKKGIEQQGDSSHRQVMAMTTPTLVVTAHPASPRGRTTRTQIETHERLRKEINGTIARGTSKNRRDRDTRAEKEPARAWLNKPVHGATRVDEKQPDERVRTRYPRPTNQPR